MPYKIKKMTMENGERYCLLVDKNSDMPLSYPNLFVTCFLRNNGVSVSTIEIALSNIIILLRFLKLKKIDLEKRIKNNAFLDLSEIEALMRYLRKNFSSLRDGAEIIPFNRNVAKGTYNYRIHTVKNYMKWICDLLLKSKGIIEKQAVDDFIKSIEAYKPNPKTYKDFGYKDKTLDDGVIQKLFGVLNVNSDMNPFTVNVRKRNRLIFLLLYHLGIRSGELLNLKINDFDLVKKTVSITRRPNDKSDTRKNQPLVKTYGRTIPITNEIIDVITDYVFNDRNLNTKNKVHDFLLVIHGNSRNRGEPLTTHAYEKIISTIKSADESLKHLSGHMLRHSWNYAFSRSLANSGISYESEDKLRKYLMGWSKKSSMCEVYNKKYISEKEKECIKSLYEFRDKVIKGE